MDELRDYGDEKKTKIHSAFLILLLGWLILLGYFAALIDDSLPAVVTEEKAGWSTFSEERAWKFLEKVVGDGPRVAGTRYHLQKTVELKDMLDDIARNGTQTVHVDWQMVDGEYWLASSRPFVNMYLNTSNLIALLEGESGFNEDGTTNSSILFNCHYDSRPTSPGASDNALFCAAMLETLSLLSKRENKMKHNIIFLFNGAEEVPLQGAPGFLKHPWATGVTGLVNLDSAGINCKSMLFQVTDSRVVSAYQRSVPRPSSQSLAEFVFSSGLVPSDTDFRIFRDFGQIYGVDIAFAKLGHVYHTRKDSLELLWPGVLQHAGDMVFSLARELAESHEFDHKTEKSSSVHWDYLNLFMLSYSLSVGTIVDVCIVLVAVASILYYIWIVGFRWSTIRELLLIMLSRVLCAASGIAALWLFTAVAVFSTNQLRYLSHSWIVVPLFWIPYLIGAVITSQLFDAWRCKKSGLNRSRRVYQAMTASRAILTLVALVLVCLATTTTFRYLITLPLLMISVVAIVSLSALNWFRLPAWQHLLLEIVLSTPCLLFMYVIAVKVNTLMIPIMGRSITSRPDYLIATLNMGLVALASVTLSGIELLFSRVRSWIVFLLLFVACLPICFVPFFPYSNDDHAPALQRHNWFHSDIRSYNAQGALTNQKTGIWFGKTEVNTPQNILEIAEQKDITFSNIKTDFSEDCDQYTYCNLPMVTTRQIEHVPGSLWVDFEGPRMSVPAPELTLENKTCVDNLCVLEFAITGPHVLSVIFHPRRNVTLSSWQFMSDVTITTWKDERPVYFLYTSRNTYSDTVEPYRFYVNFTLDSPSTTEEIVDMTLNSQRTSHPEEFTQSFTNLMNQMPDFFNIEAYISTRFNYVF